MMPLGMTSATVTVIEKILDRHVIEAQGYLDCQNILSTLGKKGRELLEAACQDLLNRGGYPSYTTVKRAMASIHADADVPRGATGDSADRCIQQRDASPGQKQRRVHQDSP